MKKKILIPIIAVVAVVAIILAMSYISSMRNIPINASYEQVTQQLKDAGYTVSVVTDAEELASYGADGLIATVFAYKGDEKLDEPTEDKLGNYASVDLFYFATEEQAETYYNNVDDFQLVYQPWVDAYYTTGNGDFRYGNSGVVAFGGLREALDLCA